MGARGLGPRQLGLGCESQQEVGRTRRTTWTPRGWAGGPGRNASKDRPSVGGGAPERYHPHPRFPSCPQHSHSLGSTGLGPHLPGSGRRAGVSRGSSHRTGPSDHAFSSLGPGLSLWSRAEALILEKGLRGRTGAPRQVGGDVTRQPDACRTFPFQRTVCSGHEDLPHPRPREEGTRFDVFQTVERREMVTAGVTGHPP